MDGRNGEGHRGAEDEVALQEAQRRILDAFGEIVAATQVLEERHARVAALEAEGAEAERLRAEYEAERVANAQLMERIRFLRERAGDDLAGDLARARDDAAALRARREADRSELDAVLTELIPIVEGLR